MRKIDEVIQGNENSLHERVVAGLLSTPHLLRKYEEMARKSDDIVNNLDEIIKILMQSPYYYL
jgi:hypothetical protein